MPPRKKKHHRERIANPNRKLTVLQLRFIEELCTGCTATEAARRAGFSEKSAAKTAYDLMHEARFAHVQAEFQRRQAERADRYNASADRIVERLSHIAFTDITEILSWDADGVTAKPSSEISKEAIALVNAVWVQSDVLGNQRVKIKHHDQLEALKVLAKIRGLMKEQVEVSGQVDLAAVKDSLARKLATLAGEPGLQREVPIQPDPGGSPAPPV